MNFVKLLLLTFAFTLPLAACDMGDNNAEQLGENVDEAVSDTKDNLGDAADEVGDTVEDTCEKATGENC